MKHPPSLARTVGSIISATSVSRVLGLARDMVQSYYFGVGPVTDAFTAAFRVPHVLRTLFAEGALSSAFVPALTAEREHRGNEAAWRLANRLFTTLLLILGLVVLVTAFGAPWILRAYVGGFPPEKLDLAVTMTRILCPFLLFVALAAVARGVLNTFGRFFVPSVAPAFFNAASIVCVIALVPVLAHFGMEPGLSLAIGAVLGGALQFLVQVPAMRGEGFRFRLDLAWRDPALRRVLWLMVPATFGLAATQINILVDTLLASMFDDGPVTYLALAFRLIQLPIGLFSVAIGSAHLARVSRDAAHDDREGLDANLAAALRAIAVLSVPAAIGLIVLREPIVRVLFEHGRFDAGDTRRMAGAVLCYALGLVAYALTKVQVPTCYALGDNRTPVLAATASVTAKIGTSFLLIFLLRANGIDPFLGLALATSLGAWINFVWVGIGLRRGVGRLDRYRVVATFMKMLVLSVLMGGVCAVGHLGLERWLGGGGLAGEIGRLVAAIAAGVACVVLGIRALDLPEGRRLFAILRRR